MEPPNIYKRLKHLGIGTNNAMDLLGLNLKRTEDEERKLLRAISCHRQHSVTKKMDVNPDQDTAIRYIQAAKSRNLWFQQSSNIKEDEVKFSTEPPQLYWPKYCSSNNNEGQQTQKQDSCSGCLASKEFFVSVGKNYLSCVNEMKSPASYSKMKPLCLQMVLTTQFFKRHEISELAQHILELASHKRTSLEESYQNELKIWNRLNRYVLRFDQKRKNGSSNKSSPSSRKAKLFSDRMDQHQNSLHVEEGRDLLAECEKRIEEMAWTEEHKRILKNPNGFKTSVRLVEELLINRISNAAIMSEWISLMAKKNLNLDSRDYDYLYTSFRQSPSNRLRNQYSLGQTSCVNFIPFKSCNKRHSFWGEAPVREVMPYLPHKVAHFLGLTVFGNQVKDIHPSWLRSFLDSSARRKFTESLQMRNQELRGSCLIAESEIRRGDIDHNMKSYFINQIQGWEQSD